MIYYEVRKFISEGKHIYCFVQLENDIETGVPDRFQGVAHIETPEGVMPIEFPFPPHVTTPEMAFAEFEHAAMAHLERLKEEAPKILTPDDLR